MQLSAKQKVCFHLETSDRNLKTTIQNLINFMQSHNLDPSQISSISAHEDGLYDKAFPQVVLFYRQDKPVNKDITSLTLSPSDTPPSTFIDTHSKLGDVRTHQITQYKAKFYNTMETWEQQAREVYGFQDDVKPISLMHTCRYQGQTNGQVMLYLSEKFNRVVTLEDTHRSGFTTRHLRSEVGWTDLVEQLEDYLNFYVLPHSLHSISIYQQDHGAWKFSEDPYQAKQLFVPLHAVVCHSNESSGTQPLQATNLNGQWFKQDAKPGYSLQLVKVKQSSWEKEFAKIADQMSKEAGMTNFKVATATDYQDETCEGVILLVKWSVSKEQLLQATTASNSADRANCFCESSNCDLF